MASGYLTKEQFRKKCWCICSDACYEDNLSGAVEVSDKQKKMRVLVHFWVESNKRYSTQLKNQSGTVQQTGYKYNITIFESDKRGGYGLTITDSLGSSRSVEVYSRLWTSRRKSEAVIEPFPNGPASYYSTKKFPNCVTPNNNGVRLSREIKIELRERDLVINYAKDGILGNSETVSRNDKTTNSVVTYDYGVGCTPMPTNSTEVLNTATNIQGISDPIIYTVEDEISNSSFNSDVVGLFSSHVADFVMKQRHQNVLSNELVLYEYYFYQASGGGVIVNVKSHSIKNIWNASVRFTITKETRYRSVTGDPITTVTSDPEEIELDVGETYTLTGRTSPSAPSQIDLDIKPSQNRDEPFYKEVFRVSNGKKEVPCVVEVAVDLPKDGDVFCINGVTSTVFVSDPTSAIFDTGWEFSYYPDPSGDVYTLLGPAGENGIKVGGTDMTGSYSGSPTVTVAAGAC